MKNLLFSTLIILFFSCGDIETVTYSLPTGKTVTLQEDPHTAPTEQVFFTSFPESGEVSLGGVKWEVSTSRPRGLDTTDMNFEEVDQYLFVHVIGKKVN